MRVEFADGTAVWEWSDAKWSNGKFTKDLLPGDIVIVNEDFGDEKVVVQVMGDCNFHDQWVIRDEKDNFGAHPRGGVVYKKSQENA